MADKFCSGCGKPLLQDDKFCPGCGKTTVRTETSTLCLSRLLRGTKGTKQQRNRTAVLFVAIIAAAIILVSVLGYLTSVPAPSVSVNVISLGESSTLPSKFGPPTYTYDPTLGMYVNPNPTASAQSGYKYVTYALYFENINAQNLQMGNPLFITLHDTKGNVYKHDPWTYIIAEQQVGKDTVGWLDSQMHTQPGDTLSGLIVFQIPQSATPKSLTYDDHTNKITINL
jgi:Domain of unknown function (DUF4352)